MTRRRDLERHRQTLADIRSIMHSLRTLAYIESRRLSRLLEAQSAVVRGIEKVADDFLAFHPEVLPSAEPTKSVLVVVGSERGFCRDFNQTLAQHPALHAPSSSTPPAIVAIGRKLHPLLEGDERVAEQLEGPSVAGEVPRVLEHLVAALQSFGTAPGLLTLSVVHHRGDDNIAVDELLPPFPGTRRPAHALAPVLTLSPRRFLTELLDQYLFAALNAVLYESLEAEHRSRVAHLEGAVDRLDEELAAAARRSNRLRQEELIEEIEVILLNASPGPPDVLGPA